MEVIDLFWQHNEYDGRIEKATTDMESANPWYPINLVKIMLKMIFNTMDNKPALIIR